jgi:histidine triad (HIT) family protein
MVCISCCNFSSSSTSDEVRLLPILSSHEIITDTKEFELRTLFVFTSVVMVRILSPCFSFCYKYDMNCAFCHIIKDQLETYKIYEDDFTIAFLDKHPIREGHLLVIPKQHETDFYKLDSKHYLALMETVKKMSSLVDKTFHPHKVGLIIAGWDVPHTHVHIVPMYDYHDITSKALLEGDRANPTDEELTETAGRLQASNNSKIS